MFPFAAQASVVKSVLFCTSAKSRKVLLNKLLKNSVQSKSSVEKDVLPSSGRSNVGAGEVVPKIVEKVSLVAHRRM